MENEQLVKWEENRKSRILKTKRRIVLRGDLSMLTGRVEMEK